ncbi:hypothetical protein [Octadecabacter ascidiaceicola]|uniref:Uncharacterized protein n=1 Tax=Octadecabacter ascidiaceicola TaxID=1655543 RepID=A0A238KNY0_9RHOB|nr:hypothetical protein [Octadecabacter ascidiaceicola]SMX44533.1 hypothetical protein OCA8868_03167 [Octadecabacter ascidiaceicola]
MVQLAEHFESKDRGTHSEWARQQRWFIKARQDTERREKVQDRLEDDLAALAAEVIMATQAQLAALEVKLDSYDEATVTALMENQELLDVVNARIEAMLNQAYVMEDGRRVFRTEDGQQVFDEHGTEVGATELDPQMIDSSLPTWEMFSSDIEQQRALETQRTEILDYQEQLDAARDQIAEGEISEADLEALDADLLDAMPDAVRSYAGIEAHAPTPGSTSQFNAPTALEPIPNLIAENSILPPSPF